MKILLNLFIIACLALTVPHTLQASDHDILTQFSTIDALLNGVYDGNTTISDVKEYGDFGLGTFNGLDGELVMLDGVVHKVPYNGKVINVPSDEKTPFIMLTWFDKDFTLPLAKGLDFGAFNKVVDKEIASRNLFYALKLTGTFLYVKTRSVPKQEKKPYAPLVEITQNQSLFEFNDIEGTIIGFRGPPFVKGISVPGYHLHFLSKDNKLGGHVLAFSTDEVSLHIDKTTTFSLHLPTEGDFLKTDLTGDKEAELKKVEN